MRQNDDEGERLPLDEWLIKMQEEYKQGYIRAVTAFAMLIIISILQSLMGIDSALTALVGALGGFIAAYFVLGLRGKGKDAAGTEEVPMEIGRRR